MKYTILESNYKLMQPCGSPVLLPLPPDSGKSLPAIEDYDLGRALGRKTRHLNGATRFFGSTCCALLQHERVKEVLNNRSERLGVYAAAETINLQDDIVFDLTVKTHGPDYVSPLQAPNTLANVMGSNFATFADITGPNCTVSSGQSSGIHCLQFATQSIAENAIDCAIVGGAEVASMYHEIAFPGSRECAVAHAVAEASPTDRVVFFSPEIWMMEESRPLATDLAGKLSVEARARFGSPWLDCVVLAFGNEQIGAGNLLAALRGSEVSGAVLEGERMYGQGETCSGLLALGIAKELLSHVSHETADMALAWVDDCQPSRLVRLGVIGVDEHGQGVVMVMEAKS